MSLSVSPATFDPLNPSASLPIYPTVAELLTSLQQALQKQNSLVTNFNAGGVTETYLEALCINLGFDSSSIPSVAIEGAYELLYQVAKSAFASTASDVFLDLKGADVGVKRKGATFANVPLQFSITQPAPIGGKVIPINTLCAAQSADPTQGQAIFTTTEVGVIPAGKTTVPTTVAGVAVKAGSSGNVPAGAINLCLSDGSLRVTNPGKGADGLDNEQDDLPAGQGYRSRVLAAIPNSSQCTILAIQEDALAFPIISSVLVENTADDGVTEQDGRGQLYVDDGSGNLGDATNANYPSLLALKAAFAKGLFRAAGTQINVRGAVRKNIDMALSVTISQAALLIGKSQADITLAIQQALFSYVDTIGMGVPVTLSRVVASARDTAGVSNVDTASVLIDGVHADLVPAVFELPRIYPDISAIVVTITGVTAYA